MVKPAEGRQVKGLRSTVAALRLRPEHAALIAQCEGLAAALDERPTAALWREYRPALELLLVAGEASLDDGEATFLELVRTPMGDAAPGGTRNARAGGRSGRAAVGPAADAVAGTGSGRRSRASA